MRKAKIRLIFCFVLVTSHAAIASPPIIAMYGDSTTAGYINNGFALTQNNEPAYLAYAFWNPTTGVIASVENHGVSSITCYDQLNGNWMRRVWQNWWQEMANSTASIVTINLGINDSVAGEAGKDSYSQCLGWLIDIAEQRNKTVAIETPNPVAAGSARDPTLVESYAEAATNVASEKGAYLIDQWTYITQYFPNWQAYSDGVHPDDVLYAYKASVAFTVLNPLVKTLNHQ